MLFAYVITAFLAHPDWAAVLRATFVPDIQWSNEYLSVLVAILGTSISPYLFFWQAAEEVEEERAEGRDTVAKRRGATDEELRRARTDVLTGMFFSNFVMYFIILTTAATLHAHGITKIATASQAAEALKPLAGKGAYWLFSLGLIGTGMLGVPVLAGSSAYAISEAMSWRASLESKPTLAPKFYGVLADRRAPRRSAGLCRPGRGENALLVGSRQWSAGAAPDRAGSAVDYRPHRDGRQGEPAAAQVDRLAGRGGDDGRRPCDVSGGVKLTLCHVTFPYTHHR